MSCSAAKPVRRTLMANDLCFLRLEEAMEARLEKVTTYMYILVFLCFSCGGVLLADASISCNRISRRSSRRRNDFWKKNRSRK